MAPLRQWSDECTEISLRGVKPAYCLKPIWSSYVVSKDFILKNQYLYPEEIYGIVPY